MSADDPRQRLSRVIAPIVDELLSMSDEEIVAETQEEGCDPEVLAAEVSKELAAAVSEAGKRRLADARKQFDGLRALRNHSAIAALSPARKEAILRQFSANDNPLQKRLTMAARGGEGLSEEEMNSVLIDLVELGALDSEGNVR